MSDDEELFQLIQKNKLSGYWNDTLVLRDIPFPSICKWNGRTILAWRPSFRTKYTPFAWIDFSNSSYSLEHIGIGVSVSHFVNVGIIKPEESRLMVLSDNSLLVTYNGRIVNTRPRRRSYHFYKAKMANTSIYFSKPLGFDYPPDQKNWIPFLQKERLLYIQMHNPLHIVEVSAVMEDQQIAYVKTGENFTHYYFCQLYFI